MLRERAEKGARSLDADKRSVACSRCGKAVRQRAQGLALRPSMHQGQSGGPHDERDLWYQAGKKALTGVHCVHRQG